MLFNTLLVIILSVSGVLSQRGWGVTYTTERICALKGSSVVMRCTYSYPTSHTVQKTFWFIHWNEPQEPEDLSQDSEYSHRVEYLGNKLSDCTFRIKQLKESDSVIYYFRFLTDHNDGKYAGKPGVSLTVTGLQVKVTEAQSVTLTCSSTCTLSGSPTFTWYKNGKVVSNQNEYSFNLASTEDTDLYSCATGGITSPAVNVKCVKVEMKSNTVSEGEWVTLTCKITCTDLTSSQTFIWYKNGQSLQNTAQTYENNNYHKFIASSGDAGSYSCAVRGHENLLSPAVTLGVRYPPKSVSVSASPSGEIVEGSSVTLTCSSSDANPSVQRYAWYKKIGAEFSWRASGRSYTINKITLRDSGEYYCEAENAIGRNRSPPKSLDVKCVLSRREWGVTYTPERICALKGSSVDMSCTYSYPTSRTVQKTFWFIHWNEPQEPEDLSQDPEYSDRVEYLGNKNSDCTFRIKHLRETDSGTYQLRFLTDCDRGKYTGVSGVTLEVTDLQVMVYPDTVTEGQSVRLTCSTTCTLTGSPAFIWYRDGSPLSFTDQSHQFTASSEDAGRYSCAVKGYELHSPAVALNVRYPPKSVSISVSPSGEIVEGHSVTLNCSSDANPPVQNYTWVKKNDTGVWQAGSGQSLNFSNFRSWDRGQYYCEAQNRLGAQNASALLVLIQDLQTGSERIVSFSNFTSWIFGQYYCVALNTHGDQTSAAGDKTALVWRVVGITVAFALFAIMVCTSRKKSTNRERRRSRCSRTSRAFRE